MAKEPRLVTLLLRREPRYGRVAMLLGEGPKNYRVCKPDAVGTPEQAHWEYLEEKANHILLEGDDSGVLEAILASYEGIRKSNEQWERDYRDAESAWQLQWRKEHPAPDFKPVYDYVAAIIPGQPHS